MERVQGIPGLERVSFITKDGRRLGGYKLRAHADAGRQPRGYLLIAQGNAMLGQEFLHVAQAEREEQIEPDRVPDDGLREPEPAVRGRLHVARLPPQLASGKPNLTIPDWLPDQGVPSYRGRG
jgi:hypothetical protein